MNNMTKEHKYYSIGELSEISGATIRTLQYYDQIGLLEAKRNESNLRYYTEKDLILLQQILFYKRVGVPLKEIKSSIKDTRNFTSFRNSLEKQSKILLQKEMEIRMNLVIIEVITAIIDENKDNAINLERLIKLILGLEKQTFLDYLHVDFDAELHEKFEDEQGTYQEIMDFYWDWKQLVLEAATLKISNIRIDKQTKYNLGKKWANFIIQSNKEGTNLGQIGEMGLEQKEKWPEEDIFLYDFTEEIIVESYNYYLKKQGEFDD